jgi:hypothetical protein
MTFSRKPYLQLEEDKYLSNLAHGKQLAFDRISPVLVVCQTREDYDLYDYFRMWSSFPTVDRPGRRLKLLIRDSGQPRSPLMGLCCLSSAVRQLRVREEWIGWQGRKSFKIRAQNLAYIMDLSNCLSVPPYSNLTGGKLLAAMMASNEVRDIYRNRYLAQRSMFRQRILIELVLITTSAVYGSNAPQYKGLSYNGSRLYQFLGYSTGYSTFQIPPELYNEVKGFVLRRRKHCDPTMAGGANAKIRILRFAARELGIREESLVLSGQRRGIFAAPLASNWKEFLLGKTRAPEYFDYPLNTIVDRWRKDWLIRRISDESVLSKVNSFQPDGARISKLLQSDADIS